MPLILAVEPDPRQASRLSVVLGARRNTAVVMAKSADTAIDSMEGRVPDVVLTSQLLSSQDEQRLADWLKKLGPVAQHVQALTIPILATSDKPAEPPQRGFLAGLRRRTETPGSHGCEPKVFAEHVATYLEQRQANRLEMGNVAGPAVPEELRLEAVGPAAVESEPAAPPIEVTVAAEEEVIAAAEETGAWLLTQTLEAEPAIDGRVAEEIDTAPIVQLRPAYELPAEVIEEPPPVTARSESQVLTMPPEVVPLQDLEVVFLPPEIITVRDDGWDQLRYAARQDYDTAVIPRSVAPVHADIPPSTPVVTTSDAPPVMDEWGLFDPSKCGFEALLDKLDEITEDERRAQADVESHVRLITHY